ncbi:hypothetical protein CORC01_04331 [Colletotrichum orchidophilum]|uniref:Metalloendopeptidase n=1 Tax=Colletotrichum orchidophilum TaxID=1209926 RepID=A0A1G4BFS1_9PEZI|nr:uncharacterized protein CORC01_04331 [Colletotrichum orchidophilum]OHF00350.1 hypothetical protein CORC01_04331 [Colletotrichum orchidophilum]
MASVSLRVLAALALVLSQPALAAVFPSNMFTRSEIEAMPLEKRGAMDTKQLWDSAEVPYILEELPHDLSELIRDGMREWEQSTCIRFLPKASQGAWVNFKKFDRGCWSGILGSPKEGETIVNLDYPNIWQKANSLGTYDGCAEGRVAVHELGHVIGLTHEQQRPDRDAYVTILENRIQKSKLPQFAVAANASTSLPFDYNSVMLYDAKAFAKTAGKHTMESKTSKAIDPWDSPTPNDFKAVNDAYGCEEYTTRVIPQCLPGLIPSDGNFSSYSFILDNHTDTYMTANNYTHLAVHQNCRSNMAGQDTDNWGFTPLKGWGPRAQYTVTTGRCRDGHDRHASRYEVALCKGETEGDCDIKCGLRRVCPFASGTQVDSKAISVIDDNLWICHPH